MMSCDFFHDTIPIILICLWISVGLTIACFVFALLFGFMWTFLRRIPIKWIQWIVTWVMEFIRSTPPLVQLFFIYYAFPVVPVIGMTLSPFTSEIGRAHV